MSEKKNSHHHKRCLANFILRNENLKLKAVLRRLTHVRDKILKTVLFLVAVKLSYLYVYLSGKQIAFPMYKIVIYLDVYHTCILRDTFIWFIPIHNA